MSQVRLDFMGRVSPVEKKVYGYGCKLVCNLVCNLGCNQAWSSFQHFSNSYSSKDEYSYCLTSDATVMVSY